MMPTPLLALFGLVLGSLIVFGPNSTTAFTVKLLGDDYTFGEVYVESLDKKNRTSIPNWDEVFPDHNGNESSRGNVDSPTSDELSLDLLSLRAPMTNNEIDVSLLLLSYYIFICLFTLKVSENGSKNTGCHERKGPPHSYNAVI